MIAFCGLSHLGIVSSVCAAEKGFTVICYDPNESRISDLKLEKLHVHEPKLDELLQKNKSKITFTSTASDISGCDIVTISPDVKTNDQNTADLTELNQLIDTMQPHLGRKATVVTLSQLPPGFSNQLVSTKFKSISFYCQVETLIFGRAVERALFPERYMIGCANPKNALPEAYSKYLSAYGCPIVPMKYTSAELCKISINLFLVSTVSTTNMIAEICEKSGADWNEIAPALKLDKRIGHYAYLSAGLGISGGNLERDLIAIRKLSRELGTDAAIVDDWLVNSSYRKDWPFRVLCESVLSKKNQPVIGVLGLAYKQDTKSIKNSPSIELIKKLSSYDVIAYDPQVLLSEHDGYLQVKQVQSASEVLASSDAVVIMTPWGEFSQIDLNTIATLKVKTIIDPYGILISKVNRKNINYFSMGVSHES